MFKASVGKVNMNRFGVIKLDVPFFSVHFCIWFMAVCNFPVDSSLLLPTVNIAVSSAKGAMVLFSVLGGHSCTVGIGLELIHFFAALLLLYS